MTLEALILLLTTLVILNWLRFRDPLYPGFIQSSIWLAVMVFLFIYRYDFNEVSSETLTLVLLGALVFSLGSAMLTWHHTPSMKPTLPQMSSLPSPRVTRVLFWAPLLGLPFMAWRAHQLESLGQLPSRYIDFKAINLRNAIMVAGHEGEGFGPLVYLFAPAVLITCICLLTFLVRRRRTDLILFSVAFLVSSGYIVLFTARILMFLLLITLAFIALTLRRVAAGRTLALTMLCFAGVFFVGGILTEKGGSLQDSFGGNLSSMYDNFLSYFVAPTVALDQLVHSARESGEFVSLRFFYAVGKALGMHVNVPLMIEPVAYVPRPGNVYTFYKPYFVDFGFVAAVGAQWVVGLWHGWLYRRATVRSPKAGDVFLFSIFMYALLLQLFNEEYIRGLSMWLQYIGFSYLFFWVLADRKARSPLAGESAALGSREVSPRLAKDGLAFLHQPLRGANGRRRPRGVP